MTETRGFTATGGASIGWVNASWPLATLSVSADRLSLSAAILGRYDFAPGEVASLKPLRIIPFVGSGVRIVHARTGYPRRIIFWCWRSPSEFIARILETGFRPQAVEALPGTSAFPIRWSAVVTVVLVWNLLFLADWLPGTMPHPPGVFILLALLLVFGLSWTASRLPIVARFLMRDGHTVGELRPLLALLQVVSGLMFVAFLVLFVSNLFVGFRH